MNETDLDMMEKEEPDKKAVQRFARKPYESNMVPAHCKIYHLTACGIKLCCFECQKRVSCKEFDGCCGECTKETYKECLERQEGGGESG